MRCVDADGPADFSLAKVAAELGVIRQTVYRYYPSVDDLFAAVGQHAVESFLVELTAHLRRRTEPADWVVEALATAIERVPDRSYLTLLLDIGHTEPFTVGVTSSGAMAIGRDLAARSNVDWAGRGYRARDLDELIELMLRVLQSMVISPPEPPRSQRALRAYLRRWVAPALT